MPTTTVQSSTVLKASAGVIRAVNVCVAGSTGGMVCDAASTGAAAASNAVAGCSYVAVGGQSFAPFIPCARGITVIPGTGQTIWVDWE